MSRSTAYLARNWPGYRCTIEARTRSKCTKARFMASISRSSIRRDLVDPTRIKTHRTLEEITHLGGHFDALLYISPF